MKFGILDLLTEVADDQGDDYAEQAARRRIKELVRA